MNLLLFFLRLQQIAQYSSVCNGLFKLFSLLLWLLLILFFINLSYAFFLLLNIETEHIKDKLIIYCLLCGKIGEQCVI